MMSGLVSPPPPTSGGPDTCEDCGFLIFWQDDHPLFCVDCGKGPLCWDCYETHSPGEEEP